MRCAGRACIPLGARCLPRLDLCPLLALSHAGSARSRKPIRRSLSLNGNKLVSLPATVFNGLTSLLYVASSPCTRTRARPPELVVAREAPRPSHARARARCASPMRVAAVARRPPSPLSTRKKMRLSLLFGYCILNYKLVQCSYKIL